MIAFSGVRSSCDMFARNSRLVPARSLELAALLVELGERRLELPRSLLDLLLETRIGLLQPLGHAVELLGERAQLVASSDVDSLIERSSADLRRRHLHRLDRPGHPAGEHDARADGQGEEDDQEQGGAPDRRVERRERLAQRLLDEHPPSGPVDRLEGAQHLCSVGVAPGRHRACLRRSVLQRRSHLRQLGEARPLQHEVRVRMRDRAAPRELIAYA